MKKVLVTVFLCFSLSNSLFAQLLMESNGNVAIKPGNYTIMSDFTIHHQGDSKICSYIFTDHDFQHIGLNLYKGGPASTGSDYNIALKSTLVGVSSSSKKAYGIYSHAYKSIGMDTSTGRMYGIYALAGNGKTGYNYGVFGTLYGYNNGAGVFGSSESSDAGIDTGDRFAGFFHGKVKVTNTIEATAFNVSSDYRLKENIKPIEPESIDNIMNLNVVKYNLKQRTIDVGDTAKVPEYYYTDDSNFLERTHYGLIAQELQQLYPDLVYEGKDGYLSVNYMEIIPILIKKIQELELKIDKMDNTPSKAAMRNAGTTNITEIESLPILYQNNPNPFTENTVVRCFIPNNVSEAILYIYDMNGHQIDSMAIQERENVTITIEGNRLDAGMYMYSLVTDGNLVDTKRMILTK